MSNDTIIDGQAELMPRTGITAFHAAVEETESAAQISQAFAEAKGQMETAIRKVLVCGLMMIDQKARCKHGEFGPWLEKHCPEIQWRTAQRWMETSDVVVSISQIRHRVVFASGGEIPLFRLLSMPASELPAEGVEIQEKVFSLVDGKTQKQLQLAWKDTEPAKREYHPPVRTPAEIAEDLKRGAEDRVKFLTSSMRLMLDGQDLALAGDACFAELDGVRIDLGHVMKQITGGRKQKAA